MTNSNLEIFLSDVDRLQLGKVSQHVRLAEISQWRTGGIARAIVAPSSPAALEHVLTRANELGVNYIIIGATTNLLFDDQGIDPVIIRIGPALAGLSIDGPKVYAEAGITCYELCATCADAGLGGIEHIAGIPGTLGGLIVMNGGSLRKSISSHIHAVTVLGPDMQRRSVPLEECAFSYRTSRFQNNRSEIIVSADLILEPRAPEDVWREMHEIINARLKKFPTQLPNCGSVFLSDAHIYKKHGPPGQLIEEAGLKGVAQGGAMISPVHANFIVNTGGAKSEDIAYLARLAQTTVLEKFEVMLRTEVRFVARDGSIVPLDEYKDYSRGNLDDLKRQSRVEA